MATNPWWRTASAAVLLVLAGIGVVLAPLTIWTRDTVLDSDTFTETIAPLAQDPLVQDQLVVLVQQQVSGAVDFVDLLDDRLPSSVATTVGTELNDRLATEIDQRVGTLVRSDTFAQVWQGLVRVSHDRALGIVQHESAFVDFDEAGTVTLDLQPLVDVAVQALQQLPVPEEVRAVLAQVLPTPPTIDTTVVIGQVEDLPTITRAVTLLDAIAGWIWWAAGLALLAGLLLARHRLRSVAIVGAAVAVGWVVVQIVLSVVGSRLDDQGELAGRVFDLVAVGLVTRLWWAVAIAAVVAVAAVVTAMVLRSRSGTTTARHP